MGYSTDLLNEIHTFLNNNLENPTGRDWIYFVLPREPMEAPRIIIKPVSEQMGSFHLNDKSMVFLMTVDIIIYSGIENVTYKGSTYNSLHFCHVIADDIISLIRTKRREMMDTYGWQNVTLVGSRVERYDFVRELYSKSIRIRVEKVVV